MRQLLVAVIASLVVFMPAGAQAQYQQPQFGQTQMAPQQYGQMQFGQGQVDPSQPGNTTLAPGQYLLTNLSTGQSVYVIVTPTGQMFTQNPPAVQGAGQQSFQPQQPQQQPGLGAALGGFLKQGMSNYLQNKFGGAGAGAGGQGGSLFSMPGLGAPAAAPAAGN
jgi:hypothetical protein